MDNNLEDKAIELAINCKWQEALETNKDIIAVDPENVDALNRLAKCYFECGQTKKAIETSKTVLKIEPSNNIAKKAVEKYSVTKTVTKNSKPPINISDFIEEPGKTKVVSLINLGQEKTVSCLDAGDEVNLQVHAHRVTIVGQDGKNIGRLPDDVSAKIRTYSKAGSKYRAIIKSADKQGVKVFIKEIKRAEKYKNIAPFSKDGGIDN